MITAMRRAPMVVAAATAVILAAPGWSAFPGRPGAIVVGLGQPGGPSGWFSVGADGKGLHKLGGWKNVDQPAFSADGRRVAVVRDSAIFVINADGTHAKPVFQGTAAGTTDPQGEPDPEADIQPAWSPDGKSIVFVRSTQNGEGIGSIWVVSSNGRGAPKLISPDTCHCGFPHCACQQPVWSPDGKWIAFSYRPESSVFAHIYKVRPDGHGLTKLTNTPNDDDYSPDWSPDGRRLAFARVRSGVPPDYSSYHSVWLVGANGSGAKQLIPETQGFSYSAVWSPDGKRLLLLTGGDFRNGVSSDGRMYLYTLASRKQLRIPLPTGTFDVGPATWQPLT
jgi:TolB protein